MRHRKEEITMVSQQFSNTIYSNITKDLKKVIAGTPDIRPLGSSEDQYKGFKESLKTKFTPFKSDSYEAQEYLFARIPVNDPNFQFFDFITPVLNIKGKSVQGIATFVASIPHPVPETFVLRGIVLAPNLLPHSLVMEQGIKEKIILKQGMIRSQAVNAINRDKKLRKRLRGAFYCQVRHSMVSKKYFKLNFDVNNYPPGMFTLVPYHGHTILIAKDAGKNMDSHVNKPAYSFKHRYEAFSGVARYLASYPEQGEEEGAFYPDSSMIFVLGPLLEHLKGQG